MKEILNSEKCYDNRFTKVLKAGVKGRDNLYHNYVISNLKDETPYAIVKFQEGTAEENGVNGCHMEDLLTIIKHRLRCFQEDDFNCLEISLALVAIKQALHWLKYHTQDRQNREKK